MLVYKAKMEQKQGFLFRSVDVVMELYAMAAAVSHARRLLDDHRPEAARAAELADLLCRNSRRKVQRLFQDLWSNEDERKNQVAARVLNGDHQWLAEEVLDLSCESHVFQMNFATGDPVPAKSR